MQFISALSLIEIKVGMEEIYKGNQYLFAGACNLSVHYVLSRLWQVDPVASYIHAHFFNRSLNVVRCSPTFEQGLGLI